MIDQWYLIFFNLLFSSLPQLVTGVLDKDVPADVLLTKPQLYKTGQNMEVKPPFPPPHLLALHAPHPAPGKFRSPQLPLNGHPGQTEKNKYHMISVTWNPILKNDIYALIYKTETDSQISKTNL